MIFKLGFVYEFIYPLDSIETDWFRLFVLVIDCILFK